MTMELMWLFAEVSMMDCTLDCTRRRLEVEGEERVSENAKNTSSRERMRARVPV